MRIEKEELIAGELGELQGMLDAVKRSVSEFSRRIAHHTELQKRGAEAGMTIAEFQQGAVNIAYLEKKRDESLLEQVSLEAKIEDKKLELMEAMKDRKTMEKLKENALREYIDEFEKNEQKIIDELVSYNGAKKSAENSL